MATNLPTLTVDFVRTIYSGSQADPIIQGLINEIDDEYGVCLLANYKDVGGSMLAANAITYRLNKFEGNQASGLIKSESAPNGASVSYDATLSSASAMSYIDENDTEGCLSDLFVIPVGMFTINGGSAP